MCGGGIYNFEKSQSFPISYVDQLNSKGTHASTIYKINT